MHFYLSMKKAIMKKFVSLALAFISLALLSPATLAGQAKILTNHVGYEPSGPKQAIILAQAGASFSACALKNRAEDEQVAAVPVKSAGPVQKWKDWDFWVIDFSSFNNQGKYYLECKTGSGNLRSFPFLVQRDLLERNTMSDVIYYFKEERSAGEMDKADRHLKFDGNKPGTVDAHGGWWDATGDYGKHLSHLSFSTYFNPQQIPLVVYSLLKSYEQTKLRGLQGFARYQPHMLAEAMFGADYLVRMKVPNGSFYRSVMNGGVDQVPEKRKIAGEMKRFGIEAQPGQGAKEMVESASNDLEYEVSYRSGGGIAVAALAMASTYPVSGDFSNAEYLKAAEAAFDYLENNNLKLTNDGKENIVDDYCALAAATELYRATHAARYKAAADKRAKSLMARQISAGGYQNYFRANNAQRPFFHASDGGFPVVSLLYYAEIADPAVKQRVLETVKKSLQFELGITGEVNNPFGLSREYVQDKTGS